MWHGHCQHHRRKVGTRVEKGVHPWGPEWVGSVFVLENFLSTWFLSSFPHPWPWGPLSLPPTHPLCCFGRDTSQVPRQLRWEPLNFTAIFFQICCFLGLEGEEVCGGFSLDVKCTEMLDDVSVKITNRKTKFCQKNKNEWIKPVMNKTSELEGKKRFERALLIPIRVWNKQGVVPWDTRWCC